MKILINYLFELIIIYFLLLAFSHRNHIHSTKIWSTHTTHPHIRPTPVTFYLPKLPNYAISSGCPHVPPAWLVTWDHVAQNWPAIRPWVRAIGGCRGAGRLWWIIRWRDGSWGGRKQKFDHGIGRGILWRCGIVGWFVFRHFA